MSQKPARGSKPPLQVRADLDREMSLLASYHILNSEVPETHTVRESGLFERLGGALDLSAKERYSAFLQERGIGKANVFGFFQKIYQSKEALEELFPGEILKDVEEFREKYDSYFEEVAKSEEVREILEKVPENVRSAADFCETLIGPLPFDALNIHLTFGTENSGWGTRFGSEMHPRISGPDIIYSARKYGTSVEEEATHRAIIEGLAHLSIPKEFRQELKAKYGEKLTHDLETGFTLALAERACNKLFGRSPDKEHWLRDRTPESYLRDKPEKAVFFASYREFYGELGDAGKPEEFFREKYVKTAERALEKSRKAPIS